MHEHIKKIIIIIIKRVIYPPAGLPFLEIVKVLSYEHALAVQRNLLCDITCMLPHLFYHYSLTDCPQNKT